MNYITISYPKTPTLKFFHLTEEGQRFLEQERSSLRKQLMENYPEQREFIENLLRAPLQE